MLLDRRVPLAQFLGRKALLLQRQLAQRLRDRFLRRLVAAQHLNRFGAPAAGEGVACGRHQSSVIRSCVIRVDESTTCGPLSTAESGFGGTTVSMSKMRPSGARR